MAQVMRVLSSRPSRGCTLIGSPEPKQIGKVQAPHEEKRLQDAFKAIKSQDVGLTVDSLSIDGTEAVVRVSRQDTINGSRMKLVQQSFRLARAGEAWTIQSIGQ
jgi:hypothetical protein